jgi:hypothetical protein
MGLCYCESQVSVAYRMPRAWRRTGIHVNLRSPRSVARDRESADGLEAVRLALLTPHPPSPILTPPTFCWVVHAHLLRSLPLATPLD